MPSSSHQALLVWATRKMEMDGFWIAGFDGSNTLPKPFIVKGVRPDAWGIAHETGLIGFAEAKTLSDIDTTHTRAQLRVLSSIRMRGVQAMCPLYIAVPRSGARILERVLRHVGLDRAKHVRSLALPDVLLDVA